MKARQSLQHDIVRLQQRLLRARESGACPPALAHDLAHVRQRNHQVLRERLAPLSAQPDLQPAVAFFFGQLYPVDWPHWRDEQCLRTFPRMCRVMPLAACEVLLAAVELDWMTHEADLRMAQSPGLHPEILADIRRRQSERIFSLGRGLARITRLPMMGLLLKCAGPMARRQGLGELHAFFTAGLAAFQAIRDPDAVLQQLEAMHL